MIQKLDKLWSTSNLTICVVSPHLYRHTYCHMMDSFNFQPECRELVDSRAANGNTPLHAAINNGSISMVRLLLKRGRADPDVCNPLCDNAAPIHLATMHGEFKPFPRKFRLEIGSIICISS